MLSGLEEPTDSLFICNCDCMDPKVIVVCVVRSLKEVTKLFC